MKKFVTFARENNAYFLLAKGSSEITLFLLSLIYQLVKYSDAATRAKWLIFLTDWKMLAIAADGSLDVIRSLNTIIKYCKGSTDKPKLEDSRDSVFTRIRTWVFSAFTTVSILYAVLDRKVDSNHPEISILNHLLDTLLCTLTYILSDIPIGTRELLIDYGIPVLFLGSYAVFYGIYQGGFDGTDEDGNLPYSVLNWRADNTTDLVLTGVYSVVLPIVMPMLARLFNFLVDTIQNIIHPRHEVEAKEIKDPLIVNTDAQGVKGLAGRLYKGFYDFFYCKSKCCSKAEENSYTFGQH
ncbi:MAG: hypothetical protein JSR33_10080 [Proteobacteria bacterium]|nr:hypothetical protein [Pseudomonadota bacterium]